MAFSTATAKKSNKAIFLTPNATHNYWIDRVNAENFARNFISSRTREQNNRSMVMKKRRIPAFSPRLFAQTMENSPIRRVPSKDASQLRSRQTSLGYADKGLHLPTATPPKEFSATQYYNSFAGRHAFKVNDMPARKLDLNEQLETIRFTKGIPYSQKKVRMQHLSTEIKRPFGVY